MSEHTGALAHKVEILKRLVHLSTVLNSTYELEALLRLLMDAAAEITQAQAASVILWDDQRRELVFTATTSNTSSLNLIGQAVPLEGSIAGAIFSRGEIVQVDDAVHDPRHYDRLDAENQFVTRSLLGVPLTIKERVIGVLEVLNRQPLPWTEDDRDYLSVLAAQASVAIESARMIAALQKVNRELNEVDKLKNDFIAIASHELRTPLAILLGYASFLKEETEGRTSEHVNKVLESGMQLRRIIEDLTNLRYLKQRPEELTRTPYSLRQMLTDTVSDLFDLASGKGHLVTVDCPAELQVLVDPIRVSMALSNIVNNAVRFTPERGSIQIIGNHDPEHPHLAQVTVLDNGIGFPPELAERIFDEFFQTEDHMTRKHGGLGIGLTIARAMIAAHGGWITAESAGPGQGAVFRFTLPLVES
jgi:signal transduction histidine kinase